MNSGVAATRDLNDVFNDTNQLSTDTPSWFADILDVKDRFEHYGAGLALNGNEETATKLAETIDGFDTSETASSSKVSASSIGCRKASTRPTRTCPT